MAEFAKEKIIRSEGDKIKKTELRNQFKEWYQASYGRGVPNARELNEFMDKRYGKYRSGGWQNVRIIYDDEDDEWMNYKIIIIIIKNIFYDLLI